MVEIIKYIEKFSFFSPKLNTDRENRENRPKSKKKQKSAFL